MLHFPSFLVSAARLALLTVPLAFGSLQAVAQDKTIVMASDGSGEFKTLQEAIASIPKSRTERTVIRLKAGTYEGPLVIPNGKVQITLMGETAETTIITWDRNVKDPIPEGADATNPGVHVRGNDFRAENVTFRNTSGDRGQGLAVRIDSDRNVFKSCRLLGWQDTVMMNKGRQYFHDCYIEGRVDFIYGDATAFFEKCEIHSKNGGYVTAASTPAEQAYGFVFYRCRLTGDTTPWADPNGKTEPKPSKFPNAYLGRPWRPYASVTFLECDMGEHIKPEGWHNWGKTENESTARYSEFGTTGPGSHPEKRVPWARTLSKEEAAKITLQSVLVGKDNWAAQLR